MKAAFDTFLPDLRSKLGFPSSITRKKERELWTYFSQVILHRDTEALQDLDGKLEELYNRSNPADMMQSLVQHLTSKQPEAARFIWAALEQAHSSAKPEQTPLSDGNELAKPDISADPNATKHEQPSHKEKRSEDNHDHE